MITFGERTQIEKIKEILSEDSIFVRAYKEAKNEYGDNVGVTRRYLIKSAMGRHNLPIFTGGTRSYIYSLLEKHFDSQFDLCPYGIDNPETPPDKEQVMAFANLSTQQIYDALSQEQNNFISLANPTGESTMSTVSVVEKVLLIDGQPASRLTDMQLVSKLSALQGNIKFLSETDTGSKKIASMIEAAKSQIKLIVDELDSRE